MGSATKQRVLRAGVTIADKYRVDEAIARGGFSIIYRGAHIEMERPVALKLLMIEDDIKASWLERFTREARLASQLTHPNTVTIYDYGQDDRGFLYIAMEWVDGESMYRHLESHGPMAPRRVAEITGQILDSLQEAHQRGFLHRDLKPSNIMLTRDYEGRETIKVLDFGIAKTLEDQPDARITHDGGFVGTPRYAAPEQLEDRELTPACDIYSLGLLMWEALVGDPPVASVHYAECVSRHLSDEPWQLPASAQTPPALASIVHRALEKSVERRYSSCRAMRNDVIEWLQSDEARRTGSADLLAGDSFVTLDDDSSVGEDDDLFADLQTDGGDIGEPPVAMYGPGEARSSPSNEAPDPLERELMEMAGASSSAESGGASNGGTAKDGPTQPPSPGPRTDRRSAPGSRSQRRRSDRRSPSRPDGPSVAQRVLWIGLAAAFLLIGALTAHALYTAVQDAQAQDDAASSGADDDSANRNDDSRSREERLDDGLPSLKADTFFLGLKRVGWRQVGERAETDSAGYPQTDARFTRRGDTVAVTVHETDSHRQAKEVVDGAEKPERASRFGHTAIQVAPAEPDDSPRAVDRFMNTVEDMRDIARKE